MKLSNLIESKSVGTYIAAKFDSATVAKLKRFVKKHDIPNPLDSNDLHSTIIYSKVKIDIEIKEKLSPKWIGKPKKFDVFTSSHTGDKALVLLYTCKEQKEYHEHIMETTDATYDYPDYNIHISLSYDIGDFDYEKLNKPDILESIGDIIIKSIYMEDLNMDWAASRKNPSED